MPLNASPPTVDGASFDLKLAAAREAAVVDFALWGGLVPGPVDRLDELAERGVVGFKAFMCPTGVDDFAMADDETLRAGMARAAQLGLPVAVHAEDPELTARLAAEAVAEGRLALRDYLHSRPVVAELRAIGRALELAEETGCSLHVVHVSSAAGVRLVTEARARGRRRHLRDLPALPRARRGGRRRDRDGGEVLAADPRARGGRGALALRPPRRRRSRRVGPLAEPARAEGRETTPSPPGAASPAPRRCCACC